MKTFYVTTAIDYANGSPHLGHASEKILADVIVRTRRQFGEEAYYVTGTDEHGLKIQQTAEKQGLSSQAYVDSLADGFKRMYTALNISNNDFIRTTEERHKAVVQQLLQRLHDKGEIYKGDYKGFYSVRQEQFVTEKERLPNGSWPELYGEVIELSEENYYFKLNQYQDWLIDFLKKNDFIYPRFRQKQVLEFLKEPLNDLCISRPVNRLNWGIPIPFDPEYVTYVWFDALINYISAVKYGQEGFEKYWPADFHVIGKDILIPSHSVYWPIMLKACGIEPPKALLVHGFWSLNNQKMSKSTGNFIDFFELVDQFGPDALRYYLTREMSVGQDSDFTLDHFLARYNSDLANDLGNLVSRLLNLVGKHFPEGLPAVSIEEQPEKDVHALWTKTQQEAQKLYEEFQYHTALEKTFAFITALNRYAEIRAPWKLAKSEETADRQALETSLATLAEGLRLGTALLVPVMPDISNRIYGLLGQGSIGVWKDELDWSNRLEGVVLEAKTILFPRPQSK